MFAPQTSASLSRLRHSSCLLRDSKVRPSVHLPVLFHTTVARGSGHTLRGVRTGLELRVLGGAEGSLGRSSLLLWRFLQLMGGEKVLPGHGVGRSVARVHGRGVDAGAAVEGSAVRAGEEAGGPVGEGDGGEGDEGGQNGAGGGVGDVAVDQLLLRAGEGDDCAELDEGGVWGEVGVKEGAKRGNGAM
jgi:hypothetical protein